jgi:HlyD family secretion protein
VLSLLPAGALEARFFIPETDRASLSLGQILSVTCDGCGALTATITAFSSTPQTTPPIIYSREERSRLVYLVKARLDPSDALHPGQPITVLP